MTERLSSGRVAAELKAGFAVPNHTRIVPHPLWNTPRYVGSAFGLLCAGRPEVDAVEAVALFVGANAAGFGYGVDTIRQARLTRQFSSRGNGLQHLTFQQRYAGLDVFGQALRVSLTPANGLICLGGSFVPEDILQPPAPFLLSERLAVQAAVASIGEQLVTYRLGAGAHGALDSTYPATYVTASGFTGEAEATRVYFPLADGRLAAAWHVVVPQEGSADVYEIVLDASSGSVLWRWNRTYFAGTETATFLAYASDSPKPWSPGSDVPNGDQGPDELSEVVVVPAEEVVGANPAGWINDGVNQLIGNNVAAHTDMDGNNLPDQPPLEGAPYRVFNYFSMPNAQQPGTYANASIVQLFYLCNRFHDRLYELGFDEAAGNFQLDNFGAGGVGGDRLQADAQDSGGLNSASFSTGASDGSQARLQMHVFFHPHPARDSGLDAEMVFHELSHGVSTRLVGPLSGPQQRALAEGWSDFLALALNAEESDDPHGTYAFGAYVSYLLWPEYTNNYYFGMRRFPYSTDFAKNPQTYADIDPAQQSYAGTVSRNTHPGEEADDPHNAGEVWGNALMQCRAAMIEQHGFAGNEIMLQLVIDGMMLTAGDPDFLRARDAILQADLVTNAGANLNRLWQAFAVRGMGFSAVSPTTGVSGIVEAYDVPTALFFTYPGGLPLLRPVGEATAVQVNINALNGTMPVPGTGELTYRIDGGAPQTISMTPTGPMSYTVDLPATPGCPGRLDYYFAVDEATLGTIVDPPAAPEAAFRLMTAIGTSALFDDNFATDNGWTVGAPGDSATLGIWTRVNPNGTSAANGMIVQPEDDHTPGADTHCFVTGQGPPGGAAGGVDVDGGATSLLSPIFDAGSGNLLISYWRWFSNNLGQSPSEDIFRVEISNNGGGSWEIAELVGPAGPEASGGWYYHEFFVADFVAPTSSVRVKFVAEDAGFPSLVEAAIDDFAVTHFPCDTTSPGDGDGDGFITLADHALFVECLAGAGVSPAPLLPLTTAGCLQGFDFESDGDVDLADAATFLAMLAAGG